MTYRVEYKYLVPERLRPGLRRVVAPFTREDPYAMLHGRGPSGFASYTVRSIYFDTAHFKYYYEKYDGLPVRAKPRIRGYGARREGQAVFLEVKRRREGVGSKARAPIAFESVADFLEGVPGKARIILTPSMPRAEADGEAFAFRYHRDGLQPVVRITYEREPYVGLFDSSLRVTCDGDIRSAAYPEIACLYDDVESRRIHPGFFVLEIKHDASSGFPVWLRAFIGTHGLVRAAISKYTAGVDAHNLTISSPSARAVPLTGFGSRRTDTRQAL